MVEQNQTKKSQMSSCDYERVDRQLAFGYSL